MLLNDYIKIVKSVCESTGRVEVRGQLYEVCSRLYVGSCLPGELLYLK